MSKDHLSRQFMDQNLVEWEAFITGGQPDTPMTARICFVCLEDPFQRPRWLSHDSQDVAEAHRELARLTEDDLVAMLQDATPLD